MSLENLTILIPTYNRHHKLKKTLRTYHALGVISKIIVLDGSDKISSIKNKDLVSKINLNILYKASSSTSMIERVENELKLHNDDNLICLGNDEDVFMPEEAAIHILGETDLLREKEDLLLGEDDLFFLES